ncbi:MAG: hypothetical protein IT288_12040 [Bdellovibrionales bacterium]|nr:hypothetical protein [Bdellovibrionales bacterium]
MKQVCCCLATFIIVGLFQSEMALAAGTRSKANAGIIAQSSKEFVAKLKDIANESSGDMVADYDAAREVREYTQSKLADAYATLFFFAHEADSQKKFLKPVGKILSKEQMKQVQAVLKKLARLPKGKVNEAELHDLILTESERLAATEVAKAEKAFSKEFQTVITEKMREKSKLQPGA